MSLESKKIIIRSIATCRTDDSYSSSPDWLSADCRLLKLRKTMEVDGNDQKLENFTEQKILETLKFFETLRFLFY